MIDNGKNSPPEPIADKVLDAVAGGGTAVPSKGFKVEIEGVKDSKILGDGSVRPVSQNGSGNGI